MQPIERHIDEQAGHVTVINTDEPVRVEIGAQSHVGPSGRWFKLWFCLVESGAWADFSPAAAKVLVVLAKHANGNPSLACWPGVSTIASDAGLSRSAVFSAISELVASGWVIRRTTGGGANATTYQLTEPRRRGPERRRSLPGSSSACDRICLADHASPRPSTPRPLVRATTTPPTPPTPTALPVRQAGLVPVRDSGPPPVRQAGRDLDPDQKNSSSTRSAVGPPVSGQIAAAAAVLKAEGFSEADVERLATHGLIRVRDAIDNCDLLQKSGRLRSGRRAFIARAIVDGYSLYEGVEKARIPAAAARLPEIVRRAATSEQLEELNAMFPSRSAIEAVFRRGVLRPADIDERTPEELLRKLLEMTA